MKKKPFLVLMMAVIMLLTVSQSAWAFNDIKNDRNAQKINELQKQGILKGQGKNGNFNPKGKLTYAEGVSLIVKGLDLNIDHIRFIKMPLASDYFPNVANDAWYSQSFIVAGNYDLGIDKSIKPTDVMTREQFAHHLFKAILTKGDYAFTEIFLLIKDQADITEAYSDSIQKLLITNIAELDKASKFYPKQSITRSDAAGWLHGAINFVKNTPPIETLPEIPTFDLKLDVAAVNKDINKVTVSTQVPHPGYGIRIAGITFEGDQAIIQVETVMPNPDQMYPQVITDVQVSTYVDAAFKPVLPVPMNEESVSSGSTGFPVE
jgi:hypothetical protein